MIVTRSVIGLLLAAFAALPQAGAQTWDGGAGNNNWGSANNWNPNAVPANNGSANLIFDGNTRLAPVMNGNWSINSLTFASTAGNFTIAPSNAAFTLTSQSGGVTNNDAGTQTLNVNTALGAAQTWTSNAGTLVIGSFGANRTLVNNGHTLTLAGAGNIRINSQFSGSGGLVKNGTGTATLSFGNANNTTLSVYSGPTTVNSGTLIVDIGGNNGIPATPLNGAITVGSADGSGSALMELRYIQQIGDTNTVRVNRTGTLRLNSATYNATLNETIGALTLEGGARVETVDGASNNATFVLNGDVTRLATGDSAAEIAGRLDLNGATRTFDVANSLADVDLLISAVVSGASGSNLVKTGGGTLVLSGANTFTTDPSGGVRIQAGVLQVSADNNLGNANNRVLLEGGTLRADGTFTADANRVFETAGTGGTIDVTAGNTLTLSTADRLRGSAPLTKTGAGTLELNQANTNFTGDATLSGGTTRLGNREALGSNASATHTVGAGATLEAAFAVNSNFQANLILAGGTLLRTSTANQKAGFQNNNAGSSLTVTADSTVRDASNDAAGGFLTFDGVVNIQSGVTLTIDSVTANSEVRFGGGQNIVLASGSTLATTGSGLVSFGSGAARTIIGQGTAANQSTLILGAASHTSNAGSRFQIDGSGIGGLRIEGTQARVDAFVTNARLAATTGSGGTLTIAYTDAGSRTLGVTANLAAASDVMLGLESAGGTFTLDGSLANWGGLVVGPSTTVSFSVDNVFGADDALIMRGGTITLGDTSQDFATFEVLGSSVLDFGAGDGTLNVGTLNIAAGATLTVRNWTESADHFFSQFDPGAANLARVYFEAQDKFGAWNKYGDPFEITPVPEPSAYGALALGGLVGWAALRRRRRA